MKNYYRYEHQVTIRATQTPGRLRAKMSFILCHLRKISDEMS